MRLRRAVEILLFILTLGLLTYAYLYPGSEALFDQRTDTFMSDGTDPTGLSYMYDLTLESWHKDPSRFFYGAVYSDVGDPETGNVFWMPQSERWLVLLQSYFFPIEQLSTAYVFTLFLLTGLSMYSLCMYLDWSRWVSAGLSLAWAFNCFTIARAKVHGAMVGTYHLPLIFLALFMIVRGTRKRSLAWAAVSLLLAATTAHYFLVMTIFLSPFFVAFVFFQPEFREHRRRIAVRYVIAVIPALLLLGLNFYFALPPEAHTTAAESMSRDTLPAGQVHPFLRTYAAHAIDYLGGNLFGSGFDLNPLRAEINAHILQTLDLSNSHERTNGIRWTILALGLVGACLLFKGNFRSDRVMRGNIMFFLIFGAFAFWLSLSPDVPFHEMGPSYWLHRLIPKVRVLSRAGINVHFALLMITGFLFSTQARGRKWLFLFPFVMVLDYAPMVAMPMAPIYPRYAALQRDKGECGVGMPVPFINPYTTPLDSYILSQRLRGSDCLRLDITPNMEHLRWLWAHFPAENQFVVDVSTHPEVADQLEKVANCVPLSWLIFHESMPKDWVTQMCQRLGWTLYPDLSCVAPPGRDRRLQKYPESCAL